MNNLKPIFRSLLITSLLTASVIVQAGTHEVYRKEAFELATSSNKTVVLDFHQEGCGTCKKQENVIKKLSNSKSFNDVTFLKVDFDKNPELNKKFKVSSKSTLVVFKGDEEVGRAIGVTDEGEISQLIQKGL